MREAGRGGDDAAPSYVGGGGCGRLQGMALAVMSGVGLWVDARADSGGVTSGIIRCRTSRQRGCWALTA